MECVFWLPIPSIHEAPLIREIAALPNTSVVLVTEGDAEPTRVAMGWEATGFGKAEVHIAPSDTERRILEQRLLGGRVHVFGGLGSYRKTRSSMRAVMRAKTETVLIKTESWDPRGPSSRIRHGRYLTRCLHYRRGIAGVLTHGALAHDQFRRVGFRDTAIFPASYYPETSSTSSSGDGDAEEAAVDTRAVRVIYVGSLIRRKRVDVALEALARCLDLEWSLLIVGSGPEEQRLKCLASSLLGDDRVEWIPLLPNTDAVAAIASCDLLVLPSEYDGWGAVVNEALLSGTRVIVSTMAGSAALVSGGSQGSVFDSRSVSDLANAFRREISGGVTPGPHRRELQEWADSAISARSGAEYMSQLVAHLQSGDPRPEPPWRTADSATS